MKHLRYDFLLSIALAVVFNAVALIIFWNHVPSDIVAPYLAGWFFDQGQFDQIYAFAPAQMYSGLPPDSWTDAVTLRAGRTEMLFPFLYPPIWAALMAPIAGFFDIPTFVRLVYVLQIPMIFGSMFLTWRLFGKPGNFVYWAIFSSILFATTTIGVLALVENQPQIFIVFLILLCLERWKAGFVRTAGVLIAVAATIKIYPVFFLLLFLAKKEWAGAISMTVCGALILVLSFILSGVELHMQYLEHLRLVSENIFMNAYNLSISALLYQIQTLVTDLALASGRYAFTTPNIAWISTVSLGLLAVGTIVIVTTFARKPNVFLAMSLMILLGLCSPFGWTYYYLPIIYCWPAVFIVFGKRTAIVLSYLLIVPLLNLLQAPLRSFDIVNGAQFLGTTMIIIVFCIFLSLGLQKTTGDKQFDVAR